MCKCDKILLSTSFTSNYHGGEPTGMKIFLVFFTAKSRSSGLASSELPFRMLLAYSESATVPLN
jgi:hypothetical protein